MDGYEFTLEIHGVYPKFIKTFVINVKCHTAGLIKGYIEEAHRRTEQKGILWTTNAGGEFVNTVLTTHFAEKGIMVQLSFVHEQSGIVERSNRTVQSTMRVLLRDSGFSKNVWGLEMNTGS